MARFIIPAAIVLVGLTLFALFDALLTPARQVRALPKWAWVPVVLLLPLVGPMMWLLLGRPTPLFGARPASGPAPRPASPDDDEEFLRSLRVRRRQAEREKELDERERELRVREEELRRRREGDEDADSAD